MKRTYSSLPETQEMPSSKVGRYQRKSKYAIRRVPRAIKTRGTPAGYYEIPTRVRQIVGFTRAGMAVTNQTDYTVSGTSYRGGGMYWSLADQVLNMGEGSATVSQGIAVPGVASLQGVFDLAKIAYLEVEARFTMAPYELNTTATPWNPSLYICFDPDDATPPLDLNTVLQYEKVHRLDSVTQKPIKFRVYPKIRRDIGLNADDIGSSTTLVESSPSIYMDLDRPSAAHMGLKMWLDVPGAAGTPAAMTLLGQIVFDIKRVVRYKVTR